MRVEYRGFTIEVNAFTGTCRIHNQTFRNLEDAKKYVNSKLSKNDN